MSLSNTPAIVIMAYNRVHALKRLIKSIINASYENYLIKLIISIDGASSSENKEVKDYSDNLHWQYGEKQVILHDNHLGIIKHVNYCLGLTEEFGSIILVEDDQYLSKFFYKFACSVLQFYSGDENIFYFSLFSHLKNGFLNIPFYPLQEDSDIFFMQLGFTQGLIISKDQWLPYKDWSENSGKIKINQHDPFHPYLLQLEKKGNEWFQTVTKYLFLTNKFIGFPRTSLSINYHDRGTHNKMQSSWYQVPILYEKQNFIFKRFEDTYSVYDSYMQIFQEKLKLLNPELDLYDFEIDLYALRQKKNLSKEHTLSIRKAKTFEKSYGYVMKPVEQNIIENVIGGGIYLAKTNQFKFSRLNDAKIKRDLFFFYNEGITKKFLLKSFILGILYKLRII